MSKRARAWVLGIAAGVGVLHLAMALARYLTFHNETFDLAFYARMSWGLARGDTWDPIVGAHVLGLHIAPVLLPLGLLGRLAGTVPVLLAAQAAAIAAAAIPLARIGARRWGDAGAVLGALAWLVYPNIGHVVAYEMHPGTLAVLPLAWLAEGIDSKSARTIVLASIGVLACREDLALVVCMAAVLAAVVVPSARRIAVGIALVAIAYFLLYVLVVHPRYAPAAGSFELHFAKWGTSASSAIVYLATHPLELVRHLAVPRRLLYLPLILGPLGLLPLARPRWLVPALPVLAMNLVSDFPTTTNLDSHYLTPIVPFLIAGALDGASVITSRWKWARPRALLVAALAVGHGIAGGTPLAFDCPWARFLPDTRTEAARQLVDAISPAASVQAPFELLPHLAERPVIHRGPPPDANADVTVLDVSHRRRFAHREALLRTTEEPATRTWLARSDRAVMMAAGDYVWVARARDPRSGLARRYLVGRAPLGDGTALTGCLAVRTAALTRAGLALDLVARSACPNDLAIRLGTTGRPTRVDLLFDGLVSPAILRPGDRLRSVHTLSDAERATIARLGVVRIGALRSSGARVDPLDPTAIDVPIR